MAYFMAYEENNLYADIVVCIDVSANMVNCLEDTKKNFKYFCERFEEAINVEYGGRLLIHTRVKVIAFRSYGVDDEPMMETKFFDIDNERDKLYKFIDSLEAKGGENGRSSSLEALTLAFKSKWETHRARKRHITLLYTNAKPSPLGVNQSASGYPKDMPGDMAELRAIWDDREIMGFHAKRLVIFAPDVEPWTDEIVFWGYNIHLPSEAGKGLDDVDYDYALRLLVASDL